MYYKKKGLPEEGEIVIVTVKKILYHSIFAILDEYQNQEGMIHISEIAPGRIRNIRDYVKEGKRLVCVVLRINKEKGHIDLSLRRVSMSLRNSKNEEYKQEIKSEKLLEYIGKDLKLKLPEMYKKIGFKFIEEFGLLSIAFNEIAAHGVEAIKDLKLPKKEEKVLVEIIQDKIKPVEVCIEADVILRSLNENGVEDIKKALLAGESAAKKNDLKVRITYTSAPKYKLEVFAQDYKDAEEDLQIVSKAILSEVKKTKSEGEVIRRK